MPCNLNDINIPVPSGSSAPIIPGFGTPSALKVPDLSPSDLFNGFPESLLDLFNNFQLLLPSGILKGNLSSNFSKDIGDLLLSLLNQLAPFLMIFKLFLPLLNLIICVIEVICAIPSPFAMIAAIRRLFRNCIPAFLNIFPIFALIILIISLLLLILALIEYLIAQILKLINVLLRNIQALNKAFQEGNAQSVISITKKIGAILCLFQNLFVLLAIFNIIIEVIRDMLKVAFAIPPCDDSGENPCCGALTCPTIVKANYTRTTGIIKYLNQVSVSSGISLPPPYSFNIDARSESWQIYDLSQESLQEFINIIDANDIPSSVNPKPSFFPSDATYDANTVISQAAYTIDLRILYNPINWGRTGITRYIRLNNCIVKLAPSRTLNTYNNGAQTVDKGVIILAGGQGFEDDGTTVLTGFASDGTTPISSQATLENFLHQAQSISTNPVLLPTDGYQYDNVEYTFKPNRETLIRKQLITLGCDPDLTADRVFVNSVISGDIGLKFKALGDLVNNAGGANPNIAAFPDPNAAQECLATALSDLRTNLSVGGVANFQAMTTICLNKLKDDTSAALGSLIGIGFDACSSSFTVSPVSQFTTKKIKVSVSLKEKTGINMINAIPSDIGSLLADRIKAYATFGEVGNFSYDGYQTFSAEIASSAPGNGSLMISFDNNIFCKNNLPTDLSVPATHTLQSADYEFVYAPGIGTGSAGNTGDSPRRDETDVVND